MLKSKQMKLFFASLFAALIFFNMHLTGKTGDHQPEDQERKPLFSFGVIADVQYCACETAGERFYNNSLTKLREAVSSLKADSAEFLINLGDIIERDFVSYKPVLAIIDSSGLKTYHLTGNHDYMVGARHKKHLPLNMPSKEGYYSFKSKNFRFIVLDGNEISIYGPGNKTAIKQAGDYIAALKKEGNINAIDWNGGISTGQLGWLMAQLDEASAKEEKVIIFCHFPVFPENMHNLLNYKEILSALEKYNNVVAWFNGHNHAGNYGNFHMIHFITMKGMVETETKGSYAIVEVYTNKIWIRGAGREKSQILAY